MFDTPAIALGNTPAIVTLPSYPSVRAIAVYNNSPYSCIVHVSGISDVTINGNEANSITLNSLFSGVITVTGVNVPNNGFYFFVRCFAPNDKFDQTYPTSLNNNTQLGGQGGAISAIFNQALLGTGTMQIANTSSKDNYMSGYRFSGYNNNASLSVIQLIFRNVFLDTSGNAIVQAIYTAIPSNSSVFLVDTFPQPLKNIIKGPIEIDVNSYVGSPVNCSTVIMGFYQ